MKPRTPHRPHRLARTAVVLALALGVTACAEQRERRAPTPVFEGDLDELLAARCGRCHGDDAGGGFRVDTYLHVLGCPGDMPETPAVMMGDAGVALLDVLEREDHSDLLSAAEQGRLRSWIDAGAPLRADRVHAPGILNPRSPEWHGRLAAADRFGPLVDRDHPGVCGRCHAGAPVTPSDARHPADAAPACTTCHREPEGVLACGTCHGDGARVYPPRDACLFPGQRSDAHGAHVENTRLRSTPLPCSTCHPAAGAELRGTHADGRVDVRFDPALAGTDASFDPETGSCAVRCHDREGARAQPSFDERGPLGCGDCHGAPPDDHYAGQCDTCHVEAEDDGSALRATGLHMNGRVDVGDGAPGCTFCHGAGGDPMPLTAGHLLHRSTTLTREIACSECHTVPQTITSPGHLDTGEVTPADVVFGPRAQAFEQTPSYDAGTCREIACHGAGLPEGIERALRWDDRGTALCSGCHGLPPAPPHPQDTNCSTVICHGTETRVGTPPLISEPGRRLHIDGAIDLGPLEPSSP